MKWVLIRFPKPPRNGELTLGQRRAWKIPKHVAGTPGTLFRKATRHMPRRLPVTMQTAREKEKKYL
jgi:hypothetical protein